MLLLNKHFLVLSMLKNCCAAYSKVLISFKKKKKKKCMDPKPNNGSVFRGEFTKKGIVLFRNHSQSSFSLYNETGIIIGFLACFCHFLICVIPLVNPVLKLHRHDCTAYMFPTLKCREQKEVNYDLWGLSDS